MTYPHEPVAVTAALLPCRLCGSPCVVERFEGSTIETVMDLYVCAANTMRGGNCTNDAYFTPEAWNRRTSTPTDAAPVGDTFGGLTTALFDLDNTARLGDNPSAVPAARDRAKTLLDWMRRHGVTVAPLRADETALGEAAKRVRKIGEGRAINLTYKSLPIQALDAFRADLLLICAINEKDRA